MAVKIPKFTWKNENVKRSVDRRTSSRQLKGKTVLADRAFSSEKIRDYIEKEGGKVCIPDKSNFKIQHDFDKEMYKKRSIDFFSE
ncbi:MAG: transposase [Selenomonadaceae bacterium]|nr:transposase [Selenomonadaceae bacterium]